jgi:hypothetical protein
MGDYQLSATRPCESPPCDQVLLLLQSYHTDNIAPTRAEESETRKWETENEEPNLEEDVPIQYCNGSVYYQTSAPCGSLYVA